jgi:hypothetical protein
MSMPDSERIEAIDAAPTGAAFQCDFCGDEVSRVRRVALDGDYERLQTRHRVRYACESCSLEKERERGGLSPRSG